MNEVALRLEFAGTPAISLRDGDAPEWIVPFDDNVVRDDVAVLEGEDIQRAHELVLLEEERHGKAAGPPAGSQRRAGGEVVERQAVDEHDAVRVVLAAMLQTVGADRQEAVAEDPPEVCGEHLESPPRLRRKRR